MIRVSRCARTNRPLLGDSRGAVVRASRSQRDTEGYYHNFANGQVHWSARGGAQATYGTLSKFYIELGGSGSRIGFPLAPEQAAGKSQSGTDGIFQRFESNFDYDQQTCEHIGLTCGAAIYSSAEHGAHVTWGGIGEFFERRGGASSSLGFPVSDEVAAESFSPSGARQTRGLFQRFEGGDVYFTDKARCVSGANGALYQRLSGVSGWLGFPISDEVLNSAVTPPWSVQQFEGGVIFQSESHGSVTVPSATMGYLGGS